MNDTAQIILAIGTAIASVLAAATSLLALWKSSENGKKIEEVHVATNGMSKAFNELTAKSAHAEGLKEGREESHQ